MKKLSLHLIILAATISLNGCGYSALLGNPAIFDHKNIEPGTAVSLDVSRRLVITTKNGNTCSEPPPDAGAEFARTFGASLSAKIKDEGIDAQLNDSVVRSIASLFERGQSVQVLRDAMYRVCEGASNGHLETGDYQKMMSQLTFSLNYLVASEVCARHSDKLADIKSDRAIEGRQESVSGYELCIQNAAQFAQDSRFN